MKTDYVKLVEKALNAADHIPNPNPLLNRMVTKAKVANILYKEYKNLQNMRDEIVRYNSDKPKDQKWDPRNIDEQFHKRAFYQAGQLGPYAKDLALAAGWGKEGVDWLRNQIFSDLTTSEINKAARKDLQNNRTSAMLGSMNPDVPVDIGVPVPKNSTAERFWYIMEATK